MNRKEFVRYAGAAGMAFTVVPSFAVSGLGLTVSSDKLNSAGIGIDGKGKVNLEKMVGQNVVALCDYDYAKPLKELAVPYTLDWDLLIGLVKARPYHPEYHPWIWQGWWNFETGALGDMGCYFLYVPNFALKSGQPVAFQLSSSLVNACNPVKMEVREGAQ